MKKILITGSNGLLGQKLIRQLAGQSPYAVVATGRGPNRLAFQSGYTYRELDITNGPQTETIIAAEEPEVIIHTAAMTNVDQCENEREACWQQNVTAVEHLVAVAQRVNAFFIHLSTDFIFDGIHGPYDETAAPNPLSHYGDSKLAAEHVVQNATGLRWAIARTVLVYGLAHDLSRSNLVLWVKKSLENGQTIRVVDDQWRTPTLAEDLATGCGLLAEKEVGGVFNIAGPDLLTPYAMAQLTAQHFGLDESLIQRVDSNTFTQPAQRPPRTGFLLEKARTVLGYQPHSFAEGLALLGRQLRGEAVY